MSTVHVKSRIKFEAAGVAEYLKDLIITDVSFELIDEFNIECSFEADPPEEQYQDHHIQSVLEHICAGIIISTGLDIIDCEITETVIPENNTRTIHQTANARITQNGLDPSEIPEYSEFADKIINSSSTKVWQVASLIYSAETTNDYYGKFWLLYSALQLLSVGQFQGNDRQRVNELMLKYAHSTEPSHLQTVVSDFGKEAGSNISIVTAARDAFSHDDTTFNNGQQYDLRYGLVLPSLFKMLDVCKIEIKALLP